MELTALAALSAGAARVAWPLGIVMATVCLIAALRTMVVLRRVFTVLTPPTLDDRCSEFLAAFVFSALLLGLWVLVTFAATIVATLVIMLAVEVIAFVALGTGASGWPGFATSLAGLAVGALIASVVVWRVFVNTLPTYGRGPR